MLLEGEQQEEAMKQAKETLEVLEGELKGKKFFGGDAIGFVDITLGWIRLCFLDLPFVKETMPPKDQLADFVKNVRQTTLASQAGK
ncbi:probable glutathione S-transferase [Pistacia vera]|uniref:probable glutathione S-transferase n=1 Tax=Pistacia vera TaxID=55513 RepID=UPI001262E153|nr:probable glutathione S-transferase [Pistacia vera]